MPPEKKKITQDLKLIFTIDNSSCTFCGLCALDCPQQVINIDKKAAFSEIDNSLCMQCGHCGAICAAGAVRTDGEQFETYPVSSINQQELISAADKLILGKRSIRSYRQKEVPAEDLQAVIKAGYMSPTASNTCQVSAVILRDAHLAAVQKAMIGLMYRVVKTANNPAGRLVLKLIGLKRYSAKSKLTSYYSRLSSAVKGESDPLFFNSPCVVILTYPKGSERFGRTDCALAGQNMMLTAEARGIGSCMIGFAEVVLKNKKIRKFTGIPDNRSVGLVFTLGYTDRKYHRYPKRKKWNLI